MPIGGFTPGTVLATDPLGVSVQRMLYVLDPTLVLAFNTKLKRYEVWNKTLTVDGPFYGFIIRCQGKDGSFREPGGWLIDFLRGRDSAHAGPEEAIKNVLDEIHESERAADAASQKKDDDAVREVAEEIAHDYTLEAQLKSDPHITGRRRYVWDKVKSVFGQAGAREAIRQEGKTK